MHDQIADFVDFMRQSGVGPFDASEIVGDDKKRRYRLEDDKPKTKNGSYALSVGGDGFAFGWALSFKEAFTHKWHTRSSRTLSAAEKMAFKVQAATAKALRDATTKAESDLAAKRAARLWDERCTKTGTTAYLDRKQVALNGARVMGDMVVVPLRRDGELTGLQFIKPDGSKVFNKNVAKDGSYFSIAKKGDDLSLIFICEGFATGGSIREAMGAPVIVAFDAGNLKSVCATIRAKYPDAKIVIAGDNDQWTTKQDGTPYNTGSDKAQQAAVSIGGARVVLPMVPADDPARRTDWNDIAVTDGIAAVKLALTAPVFERAPDDQGYEQRDYDDAGYHGPDDHADELPPYDSFGQGEGDPFTDIWPLGHNKGDYYFFPKITGQIVKLSPSSMAKMNYLGMLADRRFWDRHYGGDKVSDTAIAALASAHLMSACHKVGIFQPESTRGVGAWMDGERLVINTGDEVLCEGKSYNASAFRGDSVYESGPKIIDLSRPALGNSESSKLRDATRMLCWRRGIYADLLAGWLVVAPVGAAFAWRPHIWLTGRSGSGKSTIIDSLITPILGAVAIRRDGGTTEAGVRKALGNSGRPFILDEAESETADDRKNMEKIIFLARRASSGGIVENFNASFQARSAFCFSAINPRVEQTADKGRITQLELIQDVAAGREDRFAKLLAFINETFTPDYSKALLRRTIENMDALLTNTKTFSMAASAVMGNKRNGDQIGPLLAGAYSLTSTGLISFEDARAWMNLQDWKWSTQEDSDGDAHKLLQHIMTSRVSYDTAGSRRESSIGDMVDRAASSGTVESESASAGLRGLGIKVDNGRIYIANSSPQLRKLLVETPWVPWQRTLSDFPKAESEAKPIYYGPGLTSRSMSIPLSSVLDHHTPPDWTNEPIFEGDFA
jgi:putative DNA primase/helicase